MRSCEFNRKFISQRYSQQFLAERLKADNRKQIVKAGGIRALCSLVEDPKISMKLKQKLAYSLANLLLEGNVLHFPKYSILAHNVKRIPEKALNILISWLSSDDEELEKGISTFLANIANTGNEMTCLCS